MESSMKQTFFGGAFRRKREDQVYKGQVIATVGKTGRVTGANFHFETRKNGISIDPLKYVKY